MKSDFEVVSALIEKSENEMVGLLSEMIAIRAISPKSGGEGEDRRAQFLQEKLVGWGFDAKRYEYIDDTSIKRASVVVKHGGQKRTLWIVPHIDTVSEGDRKLWNTDPFKAHIEGGRIYGRGTSDNGQSVVGSMFALRLLKESGARPRYNVGLVLAADEEVGSKWGMQKLMQENIFSKDDLFLVPDSGNTKGDVIEVGEKGLLWLRITVKGQQVHASTPAKGKNAFRYSVRFLAAVDEHLHNKYTRTNELFHPHYSTFEMTKHEKNVDSINIIPGVDVSYIDSRVLPDYSLDEVIADVKSIASREEFRDVGIEIEPVNREDAAPVTSPDSEIVKLLSGVLKELRGIEPKTHGVGGGTCAAFPRKAGMQAAVWETVNDTEHRPNEYIEIKNMVDDAKVFARLYL